MPRAPVVAEVRRLGSRVLGDQATLETVFVNVAIMACGLFSSVIAARMLGPEGRGELAAIQLWSSLLATVAMLGQGEALLYHVARDPHRAGSYFGTSLCIAVASGALFGAVGFALLPRFLRIYSSDVLEAAQWYLLIFLVYACFGLTTFLLRGYLAFRWWNGLRLLPPVLWLGVLVNSAWRGVHSASTVALLFLFSQFLLIPLALWIAGRFVRWPWTPTRTTVRPLLQYGFPCALGFVPQLLNTRLDQLLVAAFLPPKDLGLYTTALAVASVVPPVLEAFATVVTPRISRAEDDHRGDIARDSLRATIVSAMALVAAGTLMVPWLLPRAFGEAFRDAISPALILLVANAVYGINIVAREVYRGFGRPIVSFWAEIAGAVTTGLALWVFVARFGLLGAAVASLVGYLTTLGVFGLVYAFPLGKSGRMCRRILLKAADPIPENPPFMQ